ncbi:ATP-grasp domain-containing protein [Streptomyces sp. ZYX-F-203]
MSVYHRFAGKRLALVESMLHDAFYDGVHEARRHGAEIWLLVRGEEWYTAGRPFAEHPLARVDRVLRVDTHDWRAVAAALADEECRPVVDGVMSFSDYHTETANLAAEHLGLPSQGSAAVRAANHKHLLRRALDGGAAGIRWRLVTSPEELDAAVDHVGLPLIAKPPSEAISYGVRKCHTHDEALGAFRELSRIRWSLRGQERPGHVLLEEFLRGTEISVESITVDGDTHFFGATSKSLHGGTLLEESHSFPLDLPPRVWREIRECVGEALRAIDYRQGPAHSEVMLTENGPRIVEINPRLPAHMISTMVADSCGTDPHLDSKLLALGEVPEPGRPGDGPHPASAVVVLFPDDPGWLVGIDGVDAARDHGVEVRLHAVPGDSVAGRLDNSASVGFVYAHAATADQALAKARHAAGLITIETDKIETDQEGR